MLDGEAVACEVRTVGSYARLTEERVKHLLSRGLRHEVIETAGLWSGTAAQSAEQLGFNLHSDFIVIPYRHPVTGEVVLNRVRPNIPPVFNGKAGSKKGRKGEADYPHDPGESRDQTSEVVRHPREEQ